MRVYEGYAALFCEDQVQDAFIRDSFITKGNVPILYEHKHIIGYTLSIKEDLFGLKVIFTILPFFESFVKKYKYLSIGFKTLKSFQKGRVRYIEKARVVEVSIVFTPAQKKALFWKKFM